MTLKVSIAFLVVLNLILVIKLKSHTTAEAEVNYYDKNSYTLDNVKKSARDDIIKTMGGRGVFGLVVINQYGCLMCVINEIELVNKYSEDLAKRLVIISIGPDPVFLEEKGARFSYLHFETVGEVFTNQIPFANPYLFILDKNFVYDIHITDTSIPYSKELRQAYYEYVASFLKQAI